MTILWFLLLGVCVGVISGIIGIGGGILLIPVLVFAFDFSQHKAQGTTLAMMVPPIGILAAWQYYKQGYVDLKAAGLIAAGFLVGGLLGGKIATVLPNDILQKVFGAIIIAIGIRMIIAK